MVCMDMVVNGSLWVWLFTNGWYGYGYSLMDRMDMVSLASYVNDPNIISSSIVVTRE